MSAEKPFLRIVQVSDCHVAADEDTLYRGLSAHRNLAAVLESVKRWSPELILLTGDVSEDASPESYARVSHLLTACGIPVLALPGNHDDPQIMRDYFPAGPWGEPLLHALGNWRVVMLDSTERGKIGGILSAETIGWLENQWTSEPGVHYLVALHHQPVPVSAPWIDKYRLESPESFLNVLDRTAAVRCAIWGHIHHDIRLQRGDVPFLGAPSTAANSLPESERFSLDPAGPACRWLKLFPDGAVETGLLRVED